ncbi:DUF3604 domain-containing protein [Porticoccaceae bacterium]|nr:DUF3604 domain-containing protein [Porticoccaceae bacterium]MDB9953323.1 DUF3604 domain-containing protein [Porticoccaceae bacterium]MDB9999641.1 DUF3604 domain-containing protein [Porticoccaceae bacterium]MDC0004190.1 DUF3604 domain-containing protein [Porticoccaceae bacterium]
MNKILTQSNLTLGALLSSVLLLAACADSESPAPQNSQSSAAASEDSCERFDENRTALFGDLHIHTSYSFDAAANSTGATPEDAHRYARGESIPIFPINDQGVATGRTKIDRPLDFLAVTDHGEFLGERALCRTEGSPVYNTEFCGGYRSNERIGMMMLGTVITTETPARIPEICGADGNLCRDFAKSPWENIQAASNEANTPCEFTSFVAYEYTGTPGTSNYHRNVIFRNDSVPGLPVSYIDAPIDSKLWSALDAVCDIEEGCDYLTIPHNSNLSNGRMAPYMQLEDTDAAKIAYAQSRLKREPIMEIFQHKGGSECINGLSSVFGAPDELCDVEAVRRMGEDRAFATLGLVDSKLVMGEDSKVTIECPEGTSGSNGMVGAGCVHPTDFQRSALLVGLKEEQAIGYNPVKLGIIAATDTHSATSGGVKESEWVGAVTGESTPLERLQPGLLTSGIDGNPGGLAGVWARENTRDAIFDAMLRKEVFGTSGPRIRPRLFAGWGLDEGLCEANDMVSQAYANGVPMGGDLIASASDSDKPSFLAYAVKDPEGLKLQELHLIKGWIDTEGQMNTQVLPIASEAAGADSLCQVYTDDSFDAAQSAYYYLRAVEPETARWHTYDCAAIPEADRPEVCTNGKYPDTIREMAWTSPIWYQGQ